MPPLTSKVLVLTGAPGVGEVLSDLLGRLTFGDAAAIVAVATEHPGRFRLAFDGLQIPKVGFYSRPTAIIRA